MQETNPKAGEREPGHADGSPEGRAARIMLALPIAGIAYCVSWALPVLNQIHVIQRANGQFGPGSSVHACLAPFTLLLDKPSPEFGWWRSKLLGLTPLANLAFAVSLIWSLDRPRELAPHLVLAALASFGLLWMTVAPLVGEGSLSWGYYVWEGSLMLLVIGALRRRRVACADIHGRGSSSS